MIFRQIAHDDLGCASYLVGDEDAGVAAVVDPRLEIGEYLRLARYLGVSIEHILETHNHADHVSGHGRLAAATGARIHIHAAQAPSTSTRASRTAGSSRSARARARAAHAGAPARAHRVRAHRHRARAGTVGGADRRLAVRGRHRAPRPGGREGGRRTRDLPLAADQLLALGDDVEVWPGHLGGSLCGWPAIDLKVSTTIGYERRHNELLAIDGEDAFVERATANLRPQPPNFRAIVAINRGPLRHRPIDAQPLTPRQIQQSSAPVVDVRTALQFDDAHIPGAICNTMLQPGFGTRLAWIAGPDEEVVLVGRDDADALRAVELAAAVGVGPIAGFLAGGMTSWREDRLPTASIPRITVPDLHERAGALQILDVRERDEWDAGHIPGALSTPYHDLHALPPEIDPERPVAVICASGQRAAVGASLRAAPRRARGAPRRRRRRSAWTRQGYPTDALACAPWPSPPARPLRLPAGRCGRPPGWPRTRSSSTTAPTRRCCAPRGETLLRVLEPSHRSMNSSLHALAASEEPDLGAFLYAMRRLPAAIWQGARDRDGPGGRGLRARRASARSRTWDAGRGARRAAAAGSTTATGTMAVLLASTSDLDDLIPTLVAYQIEWNKLHAAAARRGRAGRRRARRRRRAPRRSAAPSEDWMRLREAWGERSASVPRRGRARGG